MFALSTSQALANHIGCGTVITADTRLDADISGCAGDGITIGAPGITLDLDGHTISGTAAGTGIDNSAGHDRVRITNGTVAAFSNGIVLIGASAN
ncbi:MAG: hypothetical protein LC777_21070, partial [Actinobacteria bacterium]|nr:hypothetical protein [Actinomycetota bacterium]